LFLPSSGVIAATVNVLCELARHYPKEYLSLAPQLFHLLTTSSNNWMLIKIIKLVCFTVCRSPNLIPPKFGSLSPCEPRLVKKLQPPITELISTTPAISLLYECVHTCIIGGMLQGPSGDSLARLCVSKLAAFTQDVDQNCMSRLLLFLGSILRKFRSEVHCAPCHGQDCTFSSLLGGRASRYYSYERERSGHQHPNACT
jgi:AP-3 complex subunit delta-1